MLINGHAGYPDFPEDIKKIFESGMNKLANSTDPVSVDDIWNVIQILPDNHLKLSAKDVLDHETALTWHENNKKTKVGHNRLDKKDFGDVKIKDRTALIEMPNTGNMDNIDQIYAFLDKFDTLIKNNPEVYDNIIVDVRDNPGGGLIVHDYVARTLCGNEVGRDICEVMRGTKENADVMFQMDEISLEKYKEFPKLQDEATNDERGYAALYPAFKHGGINKPVFVLQNCETGSAGEGFLRMFRNHPSAITIGEISAGIFEYRSSKTIFFDNGLGMRIAGVKFTDENNNPLGTEQTGLKPDIAIEQDAYSWIKENMTSEQIKEALESKKKRVDEKAVQEKILLKMGIINPSETRKEVIREIMMGVSKVPQSNLRKLFDRVCPDRNFDEYYSKRLADLKDSYLKPVGPPAILMETKNEAKASIPAIIASKFQKE